MENRATRLEGRCDRSEVHVRLLRLFASPSYHPPVLPQVALQIAQLAHRPTVTFDDVAALLEQDPILAAKVLSLAQSALYAPRSPIRTLRQAVVRLGLKTLRDVVLEASVTLRVFRVPGYDTAMERLARHSSVTAHLMRALCRRSSLEAEHAFLCGLLHDVGIAACLLALCDDPRAGTVPFEALGGVIEEVHEEASGVVTRLWNLPAEIQRVVASHHGLGGGSAPDPVNALLVVAEHLAGEVGAAASGPGDRSGAPAAPPGLFEAACGALRLDLATVAAARDEAAEIMGKLASAA